MGSSVSTDLVLRNACITTAAELQSQFPSGRSIAIARVDVSNNALGCLPPKFFDDLPSLMDLSAVSTELRTFPTFQRAKRLARLNLSDNFIEDVEAMSLGRSLGVRFPALTCLDLGCNRLRALSVGFASLSSLVRMRIDGNQLQTLGPCLTDDEAALPWPLLESFDLRNNRDLRRLPTVLGRMQSLIDVALDGCTGLIFPPQRCLGLPVPKLLAGLLDPSLFEVVELPTPLAPQMVSAAPMATDTATHVFPRAELLWISTAPPAGVQAPPWAPKVASEGQARGPTLCGAAAAAKGCGLESDNEGVEDSQQESNVITVHEGSQNERSRYETEGFEDDEAPDRLPPAGAASSAEPSISLECRAGGASPTPAAAASSSTLASPAAACSASELAFTTPFRVTSRGEVSALAAQCSVLTSGALVPPPLRTPKRVVLACAPALPAETDSVGAPPQRVSIEGKPHMQLRGSACASSSMADGSSMAGGSSMADGCSMADGSSMAGGSSMAVGSSMAGGSRKTGRRAQPSAPDPPSMAPSAAAAVAAAASAPLRTTRVAMGPSPSAGKLGVPPTAALGMDPSCGTVPSCGEPSCASGGGILDESMLEQCGRKPRGQPQSYPGFHSPFSQVQPSYAPQPSPDPVLLTNAKRMVRRTTSQPQLLLDAPTAVAAGNEARPAVGIGDSFDRPRLRSSGSQAMLPRPVESTLGWASTPISYSSIRHQLEMLRQQQAEIVLAEATRPATAAAFAWRASERAKAAEEDGFIIRGTEARLAAAQRVAAGALATAKAVSAITPAGAPDVSQLIF